MHSRRKQRTYTVKEKQVAVLLVQDVGVEEAARILGYPRSSVSSWSKQAEKLLDFKGTKTYKTLKGQGRKELFPGVAAIVTYMKDKKKKQQQRSHTIHQKRDTVCRMQDVGVEEVARELLCARDTVHGWWQKADKLLRFTGHATSKTMRSRDRKKMFPDVTAIVTFMKDKRCDEMALTTRSIMEYMWQLGD
ncbi:hypothetical protein JG687_00014714 [Phytophthora cactorum]|uniref:Homeodomain-like n=1 Tax=Phytophthora cactorum TaxID=29920 RepID=A0A8T1U0U7_9STRA|nr:hypothetical protein JG687_00014714 [Phytophthora cactorum]